MTTRPDFLNPLIRKLNQYVRLSSMDRDTLQRLSSEHFRSYAARVDLIHEGQAPHAVFVFLSGWGYRYKQMEDGRRQILAIFLPGDCCDLNNQLLVAMDHSIGTITPATVATLLPEAVARVMAGSLRLQQALWWEALVNIAVQREWTVNLGQRSAFERVAHLLCELFIRMRAVGGTNGNVCEMPLTQVDMADATGLSAVHANRTLQELRAAGLIVLRDKLLTVPDLGALQEAAMFNPNYLHLDHEGRSLDANQE